MTTGRPPGANRLEGDGTRAADAGRADRHWDPCSRRRTDCRGGAGRRGSG
jgi:hypothetical protein